MNTPNTPYEKLESATPEWYEPFPQPQTIPSGWDLSGFADQPEPARLVEPEPQVNG